MKKSIDYHAANIIQHHVELQHLPQYHPDYEKIQDKLSRQLTAWSGKLSVTIHVALNEQQPWTTEEIGYSIIPMATKQKSGTPQTGDCIFYLDDYDMFGGLCVERKGVKRGNGRMVSSDLYGSFAKKDNRRRFYAEFQRYRNDPRFNHFLILVECSHLEYLTFKPHFNGQNYNMTNQGMSIESRRATLAKLDMMGAVVKFMGTRKASVEYYHNLIQQWCRVNYAKILNIDD